MLPRHKKPFSFVLYILGTGCLTVKNILESVISSESFLTMAIHHESLPDTKMLILGLSPQLFLTKSQLHKIGII